MIVEGCIMGREHCPYCGAHGLTIIPEHVLMFFRGEKFWCGYCHSTFSPETPKQPFREQITP